MTDRVREFASIAHRVGGVFRGHYRGRGFHEGIAADFDSYSDLVRFVADASASEELRKLFSCSEVHLDSMGLGIVASWERRAWTDEEWELAPSLAREEDC